MVYTDRRTSTTEVGGGWGVNESEQTVLELHNNNVRRSDQREQKDKLSQYSYQTIYQIDIA